MLIFTECLAKSVNATFDFKLALTAEQRTRSRQSINLPDGKQAYLQLPRGTILNEGDLLKSETSDHIAQVIAKSELIITIYADNPFNLIRAAYHLGNRHVPVEITANYLRISSDPVLQEMLIHLGLNLKTEIVPFYPEAGAYHSHH